MATREAKKRAAQVRLDPALHRQLSQLAAANNRSLAAEILTAIQKHAGGAG